MEPTSEFESGAGEKNIYINYQRHIQMQTLVMQTSVFYLNIFFAYTQKQ